MIAPHWLDDIFASESPEQALVKHRKFKAAIAAAHAAKLSAENFSEENPGVVGMSPEQHARRAFLDAAEISEAEQN